MKEESKQVRRQQAKKPNPKAAKVQKAKDNPEVPPASEVWVEGQPTSDADYPK